MVNGLTEERLYSLLPAIYRARDVEQGEPLRALMGILQSEFDRLELDITDLNENWFIETCSDWVVPYLGDLLGVTSLHSVASAATFSQRAYVANVLRLRRRKGTAAVLEQLARDVTGWPARAVEFFQRLSTTQHLNHVRLAAVSMVNLRDANQLEHVGGPFEQATRSAEVRRIASHRGTHNIPNIGLFLWRLQSYFISRGTAQAVSQPADGRYTFSPLGNQAPLFNRPRTESEITHLAEELNVPGPLRRRPLFDELEALRQASLDDQFPSAYFGDQPVFQVFIDGQTEPVPFQEILICDLSDPPVPIPDGWRRPPDTKPYTDSQGITTNLPITLAVDPVLGRLAFPIGVTPGQVQVSYAYGFSADTGGGPYGRRDTLVDPSSVVSLQRTVDQTDPDADFSDLSAALSNLWDSGNTESIITITDNATYVLDENITALQMDRDRTLVIQADEGNRPVLRLVRGMMDLADLVIEPDPTVTDAAPGQSVTLNGLLIEGGIVVRADSLESLNIMHCTLVPGRGLDGAGEARQANEPSLMVEQPNSDLRVRISDSIVGPLRVPETITDLTIVDSLVDSPVRGRAIYFGDGGQPPGPPITLERTTVFGSVQVREVNLVSETIFTEPAVVQSRQVGCTRFSYLAAGSQLPRPFHSQPDLALAGVTDPGAQASIRARLTPAFTSERYAAPGYAQLSRSVAVEIRTGAEEGAEIGVFSQLKQPQRLSNLLASLEEYMRFGLESGIFFST